MAFLLGVLPLVSMLINQMVFDTGLLVASGEPVLNELIWYLALFAFISIVPTAIYDYVYEYSSHKSQLVLRTAYKGKLLKKLKTLRYEHFEREDSMEIIDKAYNRTEGAAQHLWPMFAVSSISSIVGSVLLMTHFARVSWWLPATILAPFLINKLYVAKFNNNIYELLESFWPQERLYTLLGSFFRSREFVKEMRLYNSADYLISTHTKRLNERNRMYEKFFFKNLRFVFASGALEKVGVCINVIAILYLYISGAITSGAFLAMSVAMLSIYGTLGGVFTLFVNSAYHVNFFEFYDKFFALSDDEEGSNKGLPDRHDIVFDDVWFRYPGTDKDVLKGISFQISEGESVAMVGKNGEGKSTIVKLLLGLFVPDRGTITVGGNPLHTYSLASRAKLFGSVFQDFTRYSITIKENIAAGDIDSLNDEKRLIKAAKVAKVDAFAEKLADKYETLLGRDFEGGVDLSGGQWQRIALARAFVGDNPILLLDEPTSQLDPMAEAKLYGEFSDMSQGKTSILITHRLGATKITDRIILVDGGIVSEEGTHAQLMQCDGMYAEMFNAQKDWYQEGGTDDEE